MVAHPARRVGRPVSRRSGGATAAVFDAQQPARAAHALRPAGAALVVAHRRGDPLEHLLLGLALRAVLLRTGLQERQKRMLVHEFVPDFVMEIVTIRSQ
jgi:hypothetical protein